MVMSIPNGHMHSQTYGRVNARVREKVLVLFRESFNATTTFSAITPFSVECFSGGASRTDKIKTSIYGFNMLL